VIDVLIVGAGPAGSAAARLLAAWGHDVLMVDRPGSDAGRLAESIPPSAQKVLAAIGALTAVEDAGFIRWRGNTVWWAGEPPRTETFAPGAAGYQVERGRFDALLKGLAAQAGAGVQTGIVREVHVPGLTAAGDIHGPAASPVEAVVEAGGERSRVQAAYVVDCSGRTGALARRGLRIAASAPRTIALAGVWRAPGGWALDDDSHTLVASYADGWAWSVPAAPGVRHFTVMVDPARTGLARAAAPREIYLAELDKVDPFRPFLERGTLTEGPWGADASIYHAGRYAGPGWLLAGDAASTIDPLSSFGVKKALASGWLAAIAAHTAIARPAMRDEALAFFDRRERALYAHARRRALLFAAEVAGRTAHPFWTSRAETAETHLDAEGPDALALAADEGVRAAFENLRQRPAIGLRRSATARVSPRAAVRGREIVLEDHVFLPDWPDGVRYLRGVDLVDLLSLAPSHADVGELYRAFSDSHPNVSLPDFLGALSVLIARCLLVHHDAEAGFRS
jgi:flavin-dependent dehydrogenase